MIANPYKILEISQNATNEEIKKAYRELSRKYHPDSYVNNPLSNLAEEKFKEVQEAYEQIMKERESGNSGYNGGSATYGQAYNGGNAGEGPVELNVVFTYLNSGRYQEALNILSGISMRSAGWYYYSAVGNSGIGNNILALEHAQQAVSMEPENPEFLKLFNQLKWKTQRYQNTRNTSGGGYNTNNLCCDLWCADSLCECMGGDLISCC